MSDDDHTVIWPAFHWNVLEDWVIFNDDGSVAQEASGDPSEYLIVGITFLKEDGSEPQPVLTHKVIDYRPFAEAPPQFALSSMSLLVCHLLHEEIGECSTS